MAVYNWTEQNGIPAESQIPGPRTWGIVQTDGSIADGSETDGDIASPNQNGVGFLIRNGLLNDGSFETTIHNYGYETYGGIVFRWTASDSYYYLGMKIHTLDNQNVKLSVAMYLFKSQFPSAVNATALDSNSDCIWWKEVIMSDHTPPFPVILNDTAIKVDMSGSTFTFYVNGALIDTFTDTSSPLLTGQIGYVYGHNWQGKIPRFTYGSGNSIVTPTVVLDQKINPYF